MNWTRSNGRNVLTLKSDYECKQFQLGDDERGNHNDILKNDVYDCFILVSLKLLDSCICKRWENLEHAVADFLLFAF